MPSSEAILHMWKRGCSRCLRTEAREDNRGFQVF